MLFSHDTEHSLACAVDLVNSAPSGSYGEGLPDLGALQDFVRRHDVSDVRRLTAADLHAVHLLRDSVRAVFSAADDSDAAVVINRLVSQAGVTPRLTDHDGYDWHIHYFTPGATLADHLALDCGMALAQVVAAGEKERLRRCEAPDCDQVLVDLSRNRSKRYCDARTCGNRLHVAAYRERQRASQ
ncbi:MAG TPA: CGNR zinc finger domain-containing protein [Nocardioides sp.]|uniref:CGNR zinc finger domain-containing protein n=1 Tax=Nocardioides sp. TaxID=35761 RepID=UPI002D80DBE8|nr:CGNR zinc finger domain-containing protein [Nocardioides sp.]HET6654044.1 CGNR zinc finger domain-containing protein [Nocardioides sp.]